MNEFGAHDNNFNDKYVFQMYDSIIDYDYCNFFNRLPDQYTHSKETILIFMVYCLGQHQKEMTHFLPVRGVGAKKSFLNSGTIVILVNYCQKKFDLERSP